MPASCTTSASAPTSATCCGSSRGSIARPSTSCCAASRTSASPRTLGDELPRRARAVAQLLACANRFTSRWVLDARAARRVPRAALRAAALAVRARSVVTIHDCIHLMFPQYLPNRAAYAYARASMWAAARRPTRILTVSEASKRDILHFFNVPPEKIVVIYNAIDERFCDRAAAGGRSRACASATSSITSSCSTPATSSRTRTSSG